MAANPNLAERRETLDRLNTFVRQVVSKFRDERRSDVELLAQFVESGDEEAFQAIVGRHGGSVWAACLAVLGDPHDAEDAFQAAFMALARRAATVDAQRGIGPWVRSAARAAARKLLRGAHRLNRLRDRLAADPSTGAPTDEPVIDESNTWVLAAEELEGLPRRLRDAVILYHLEGRTLAQVAELTGCSIAEVHRRLNHGLELLRTRLSARGVALTAGILAAIPAGLVMNTASAATAFARGSALPTPRAAALADAILAPRFPTWFIAVGATLLLAAGTAVALVAYPAQKPEFPSLPLTNSAVSSAAPADAPVGPELAPAPRPSSRVFRHDGTVTALVVSPDGKRVASAGTDNVVRVWDSATGKQVASFDAPPEGVKALAFTPDSSTLVAEDPKSGLAFWDIATGKRRENFQGQPTGVEAMAFGSDGKRMVTIGHDGQLASLDFTRPRNAHDRNLAEKEALAKFWGRIFREILPQPPTDEPKSVTRVVAFTPDAKTIYAVNFAANRKLFISRVDVRSGRVELLDLATMKGTNVVQPVSAVAISANADWMAWGNGNNEVGLGDLAGSGPIRKIRGHKSAVVALAFSPDGRTLASVDADGFVIRATLPRLGVDLEARGSNFRFRAQVLAFSPDGKHLYGAGVDGEIHCWDATTLNPVPPIREK